MLYGQNQKRNNMRLMLGTKDHPSLLVDVGDGIDRNLFDFWVVNGAWEGTFINGHITIHHGHDYDDYSTLNRVEILCDDQDRLRGDYNDVFNNFNNPKYVAPMPKVVECPASWDDDIPF